MARVLSELLEAHEPAFTNMLKRLEVQSGMPSVDVRLVADIEGKVQQKIRELGLDPADTNAQELYQALQALTEKHDSFLARAVGGANPTDIADLVPRIIATINNLDIPKSAWALKPAAAKKILHAMPPKTVMKQLGYKSIDSMLKREHISEIYAALRFVEDSGWLERFIKTYKKLQPNDFESRNIEIIALAPEKWGDLAENFIYQKRHNIAHLKELGVIAVLPFPFHRLRGISIVLFPLLLHYLNEIRLYSTFFKLQQVKPHFGSVVANTLLYDEKLLEVGGQPIHWRTVQRHFGKSAPEILPEVFEPHVQTEDLDWRQAEAILYQIEPALKFWEDLDFVGVTLNGQTVSFNLMDNAVSYCNRLEYAQAAHFRLRDSLWSELMMRYLAQKNFEDEVLKQLDNQARLTKTLTGSQRG